MMVVRLLWEQVDWVRLPAARFVLLSVYIIMKSIILGIIIFVAVIGVIFYFQRNRAEVPASDAITDEEIIKVDNAMPVPSDDEVVEDKIVTKIFTLAEIAPHNNKDNCCYRIQ